MVYSLNQDWIDKVKDLLGPICEGESCELYDVESTGSRSSRVLKVFIDAQGGVTIEQCANVSNALSLILDVEDVVPGGKYSLEVSSPGLERSLKEPWHFEKAVNKEVKIKTQQGVMPVQGPETKKGLKLLKGCLKAINGQVLTLEDDKSRVYEIEMTNVTQAHTVFVFDKPGKKKKN